MKFSQRMGFIDRESYVAQYLALSLFTIGVTSTIGSDDLLAAFAAGLSLMTLQQLILDLMYILRFSYQLGWSFQCSSRRRSIFVSDRPHPQLWLFRIH